MSNEPIIIPLSMEGSANMRIVVSGSCVNIERTVR